MKKATPLQSVAIESITEVSIPDGTYRGRIKTSWVSFWVHDKRYLMKVSLAIKSINSEPCTVSCIDGFLSVTVG